MQDEGAASNAAYTSSASTVPSAFIAPLDSSLPSGLYNVNGVDWGKCNYAANHSVFGTPGNGTNWTGFVNNSFDNPKRKISTISDGASNTLMFGERYAKCSSGGSLWAYRNTDPAPTGPNYPGWARMAFFPVNWVSNDLSTPYTAAPPQNMPLVANCSPYNLQSFSASGCQISMCDGSVRNVRTSVSSTTWFAVIWPDDGLSIGDW